MKKRFFGSHYANRNLFWRMRVRNFLALHPPLKGYWAMKRAFTWLKSRIGFRRGGE